MADEIEIGSAGAAHRPGHSGRGSGEQSPLQARAPFLKNRSWEFVVSLNRGACTRGKAQHGQNSESHAAVAADWEHKREEILSLNETIEFLRQCHRRAPFLFFNGNTFADIARALVDLIFAELPTARRREVISGVAHYVAGVLDRDSMVEIIESLCQAADFKPGDRVRTLRGTVHGVIVRIQPDGQVVWQRDNADTELLSLPESLVRERAGRQ